MSGTVIEHFENENDYKILKKYEKLCNTKSPTIIQFGRRLLVLS